MEASGVWVMADDVGTAVASDMGDPVVARSSANYHEHSTVPVP